MDYPKKEKELILKKHVNAIHSSNNLTLVQRKLFNVLTVNAYANLLNQVQFEIPVKQLCIHIGYNSHDYKSLKKALLGLINIVIEWDVIDYSSPNNSITKWRASSILAAAELHNGICRYEYSSILKELLYMPEMYGRINIEVQAKFKSTFGLALYENCIRYKGLPQTPWFNMTTFRKLMGVDESKYKEFCDFKRKVLDIAIREVNQHAKSITIKAEIKKERQKSVGIRFLLSSHQEPGHKINDKTDDELINTLIDEFKIAPEVINNLMEQYDANYMREKIQIIYSSNSFKSGKVRELGGLLINALKSDYKAAKSSKEIIHHQNKAKEDLVLKEKTQQNKKEKLKNQYDEHTYSVIKNYLNGLEKSEKESVITGFLDNLKNKKSHIALGWFKKNGLEHPGIKSLLKEFILTQEKVAIEEIETFESFIMRKEEVEA